MINFMDRAWKELFTWPEDRTEIKKAFGSAEAVIWHTMHKLPQRQRGG